MKVPLWTRSKQIPNTVSGCRRGGGYLENEEISLIRQWIEEGAHESPPTRIADREEIPGRFELRGNYPNPFNPKTTVRFYLPRPASWSLTVYTASGSYVWEDSGWSGAGEVAIPVNLDALSSGTYIYVVEMRADQTTHARLSGRMTLLK